MSSTKDSGSAAAGGGFPSPAEHFATRPLSLDDLLVVHPAATFFVRMQGGALEQKGVFDGDILVVDRSLSPVSGDMVVVLVNDEYIVRTLRIEGEVVRLEAASTGTDDIVFSSRKPVVFFGKVTAIVRKL